LINEFARGLPEGCQRFARGLPEGCQRVASRLPEGCQPFARGLPAVCQRVARRVASRLPGVGRVSKKAEKRAVKFYSGDLIRFEGVQRGLELLWAVDQF